MCAVKNYLTKFGKYMSSNLVILPEKNIYFLSNQTTNCCCFAATLTKDFFIWVECELWVDFSDKMLKYTYIERKNILFITNYAIFCELIWHQALLHVKEICLTSSITKWNGPFGKYLELWSVSFTRQIHRQRHARWIGVKFY